MDKLVGARRIFHLVEILREVAGGISANKGGVTIHEALWINWDKKGGLCKGWHKNLYVGGIDKVPPYMGVVKKRLFEQKGDFSPKKGGYPQFSTSYPQLVAR